ncbi:RNase H1/viroplasmin domain-containing protein [Pediococcus acidilactici]
MAKQKYYVVKIGKQPGIYRTWAETEAQVKGFSGASYKSFGTLEEAEQWQAGKEVTEAKSAKKAIPQKQPQIPQKILRFQPIGSFYIRTADPAIRVP